MSLFERYPDAKAAAEACGAEVTRLLSLALGERGIATLAISGGTSPKVMFEWFARCGFDWSRAHVFWVDERCVPYDDPRSNFKLAHDAWLGPANVPASHIHAVHTALAPEESAARYAETIRPFLPLDVIHRGMGADAHTASLFPGDPAILDATGLTAAVHNGPPPATTRVTLLPTVLQSARHTLILATGADKAAPLHSVLRAAYDPMKYPAQIASLDPARAKWFLDEAAASLL